MTLIRTLVAYLRWHAVDGRIAINVFTVECVCDDRISVLSLRSIGCNQNGFVCLHQTCNVAILGGCECVCVCVSVCRYGNTEHHNHHSTYVSVYSRFKNMWKNPIGNKMENILITESANRKWFFGRIKLRRGVGQTHAILRTYNRIFIITIRAYVRNVMFICVLRFIHFILFVTNCSFSISHTRHMWPLNLFSFYSLCRITFGYICTRKHVGSSILICDKSWIKYRCAYHRMVVL